MNNRTSMLTLDISETNYTICIFHARKLQCSTLEMQNDFTQSISDYAQSLANAIHLTYMYFVVQIINTHRWQYSSMHSVLIYLIRALSLSVSDNNDNIWDIIQLHAGPILISFQKKISE